MKIEISGMMHELQEIIFSSINAAKKLKASSPQKLNQRASPEKWSALECIEHLNLYGDFYLPEIEKQLIRQKFPADKNTRLFRSGLLGNYFAKLMKAGNGKIKKMNAPENKNPLHAALTVTTIDRFIKQLEKLNILLVESRKVDLTKTKTAISISPFIKLRLGDTFRFLLYHIERHMLQAENASQE